MESTSTIDMASNAGWQTIAAYLLHPFATLAVAACLSVQALPGRAFALALVLTLAFAALSGHLLEQPAIAWSRRLTAS
jgi:peptidoglycan/LPS O-acetylase OafA/YrhL